MKPRSRSASSIFSATPRPKSLILLVSVNALNRVSDCAYEEIFRFERCAPRGVRSGPRARRPEVSITSRRRQALADVRARSPGALDVRTDECHLGVGHQAVVLVQVRLLDAAEAVLRCRNGHHRHMRPLAGLGAATGRLTEQWSLQAWCLTREAILARACRGMTCGHRWQTGFQRTERRSSGRSRASIGVPGRTR